MDEDKSCYFDYLKQLTTKIEDMQKPYHIGILQILLKYDEACINENKNGIYINMSELKDITVKHIQDYLDYIVFQEKNLNFMQAKQDDVAKNILMK
jgi:hypothetical protein